jgi:hypothetical protein
VSASSAGEAGVSRRLLVVEVDTDTDPNSAAFKSGVLDAIESTAKDVLKNESTMVVSHWRVVPKLC